MLQHALFASVVALAWFGLLSACAAACFFAGAPIARRRLAVSGRTAIALRLTPAGSSVVAVLAIVVPAFAWLEPVRAVGPIERMGAIGMSLAVAGSFVLVIAIVRGIRAIVRTRRTMRIVTIGAAPERSSGSPIPVLITESPLPVMVLDGVFRPRLYVSQSVRDALTPEEFDRAVAHECAHHAAWDNAKRRLLAFVPDLVGSSALGRALAERWQCEAELAADAAAARSDRAAALALASALVKVARLHAGQPPLNLGCAAFHDGRPVSVRVHRLLEGDSEPAPVGGSRASGFCVAASAIAFATLAPALLTMAHQVTEFLVHLP